MRLGLAALKLDPDRFWRMTLREICAAAGMSPVATMSRHDLQALMSAWPDPPVSI
jgi:uncharacterized phage protein (TIGR02216 family)